MVGELFEDEKIAKYHEALDQSVNSRETAVQDYFQVADSQITDSQMTDSSNSTSQAIN